jgi:acetyltransferase-like isoleucine patch superfamily enzyme
MLSEQDRQQLDSEMDAFRRWRAGDKNQPLVLKRHQNYCPCEILFQKKLENVKFYLRFAVMRIISALPSSTLKIWFYRLMGAKIGKDVFIAPGVFIDAFYPRLIEIEDDAFLGTGCRLLTHEYTADYFRAGRVRIGKGSVVGGWSIIRCGVTLGEKVTTGFGSVVVSDVADGLCVGGVPAKPLKSRKDGA